MPVKYARISIYSKSYSFAGTSISITKILLPITLLISLVMSFAISKWSSLHTNNFFKYPFIAVSLALFAYIIFVEVQRFICGDSKKNKSAESAFVMYGLIILAVVAVVYTFINHYEQIPMLPALGFLLTNVSSLLTGSPGVISLVLNILLALVCAYVAYAQSSTPYHLIGVASILIMIAFGIKVSFFNEEGDSKKKNRDDAMKYITALIGLVSAVLFVYGMANSRYFYNAFFAVEPNSV